MLNQISACSFFLAAMAFRFRFSTDNYYYVKIKFILSVDFVCLLKSLVSTREIDSWEVLCR